MRERSTRIALLVLLLTFFSGSFCEGHVQDKQNAVYAELGGNAGFYSVNYERRLTNHVGARIGVGYIYFWGSAVTIPAMVNTLIGNGNHMLELGIGATFGAESVNGENWEIGATPTATIGYRHYQQDGGLVFRVGLTPFWDVDEGIQVWAGISVGYAF